MSKIDTLVCDLQAIARASNLAPALCQRVEDAATALTKLVEALTNCAGSLQCAIGVIDADRRIYWMGEDAARRHVETARQALNEGVQP